jgi:hypothetical protein
MSYPAWTIRQELADIGYSRMELVLPERPKFGLPEDVSSPAALRLQPAGELLVVLMSLEKVDALVRATAIGLLWEPYSGPKNDASAS